MGLCLCMEADLGKAPCARGWVANRQLTDGTIKIVTLIRYQ